jgi:hypothetical protein
LALARGSKASQQPTLSSSINLFQIDPLSIPRLALQGPPSIKAQNNFNPIIMDLIQMPIFCLKVLLRDQAFQAVKRQ